ncbi:phage tail protein [Spirosoma validum]|uniref:Phage tail protein n=1 Tax=Spirosoma validum TaxID=2771355 RepID=A0A927GDL4_9BACT|nr:tail fiber protein [Spirosoma validum]MBD2753686.1 phage tail protein [Spirosoma validum]
MEPFIGQICLFPYNYAPRGWAFCQGQLLQINQYTALFSLLGTTYGGNGQTTFGLPDLRGRVAISSGQGPGLGSYSLGQVAGTENVTLNSNQMPSHSHALMGSTDAATASTISNNVPATSNGSTEGSETPVTVNAYAAANNLVPANPNAIGAAGGNQGHDNMQPYLCLNYCIALEGIFPSRN